MLAKTRLFRVVLEKRLQVPLFSFFHHEFTNSESENSANSDATKKSEPKREQQPQKSNKIGIAVSQKYKIYRDEDSSEIFDVEEERQRFLLPDEPSQQMNDAYLGLNLEHGVHGVFDIEDLVDVLRKENAEDIFVCSVPKELKYVDYMAVCSGRSYRHMLALAEFVRHIYKVKRTQGDVLPKIEGGKSREWMALDLGNIALHIFSPKSREEYDLESLWAIGSEYDKEFNKQDQWSELFEHHTNLLADFKPKTDTEQK